MGRIVAHAVCGFFLVATAAAVLLAGPLTSNAAVRVIATLPDAARLLSAISL
jgi:hypothetical protein